MCIHTFTCYQLVMQKRASTSREETLITYTQITVRFNTCCYSAFEMCVVCAGQV